VTLAHAEPLNLDRVRIIVGYEARAVDT